MNQFKKYKKSSTLINDGFQVFNYPNILDLLTDSFFPNNDKDDLINISKEVAYKLDDTNIFRTKLGDIKQIQNLHKVFDLNTINKELASLIGWESFETLNNQFFCKPPNYKMTSAHQDNAYFECNNEVVTFWIPIQDVDLLNSCMFYVPGSHKNGLVEHKPIGTNIRNRTGRTGVSLYSDFYKNNMFVKVPMSYGEILVHDKNTMHFSSANQTDDYRISFTAIIKKI